MSINVLGQRWQPWVNYKLGFSTNTTIGSHGCTITCVAMLAGLNPDQVNDRLKAVSGYANTNLIIWQKIEEAIPWLKFEWRGYAYEDTRVKDAIKKNGGCLVEVDFDGTPRTDDRHWVLAVGNGKIYDPWTGKEEPFSKYSILTGYSIINKIGESPIGGGNMAETVQLDKPTFEKLVSKSSKYDEFERMGYSDPQAVKTSMVSKDETINGLSSDLSKARKDLDEVKGQLSTAAELTKEATDKYVASQKTVDLVKKVGKDNFGLKDSSFESEEAFSKALASLSKGGNISEATTSELLNEIMRRFTSALDVFKKKE